VDLSEVLTASLTKKDIRVLAELLKPANIEVLMSREARRWRIKLTSSCRRLQA